MTEESIFRDVPAGATYVKDKVIKSEDVYNRTYTGYLVKGVPNGHGTMTLTHSLGNLGQRKVTYEGNFTDGKKNGFFTVSEGRSVAHETYDMDRLVHEKKYENINGMNEADRLNKSNEHWQNVGLGVREFVHQIPMPFQRRNNVFANARTRRGGTRRRKQTKRGKKSKKTRKNMRKLV